MKKFKIDFFAHRKVYFLISAAILVVGILCNFIFGSDLSIQFRGGTIIKYSYTGEVDVEKVAAIVEEATGKSADVAINHNVQT